jgi:hypothetical protein
VALNALISVVRRKLSRREFAAVVGAQHVQLATALRLRSSCVRLMASAASPLLLRTNTYM